MIHRLWRPAFVRLTVVTVGGAFSLGIARFALAGPGDAASRTQVSPRIYLPFGLQAWPRESLAPALPMTPGPTRTATRTLPPTELPPTEVVLPSPSPTPTRQPTVVPVPSPTRSTTGCSLIETFETGRTPTAEIHVAVDGSDSTGDGSLAKPFAGLRRAAQASRAGTAIRVHAGTYRGGAFIEGLRGTADAPIWLGGAPGEARPVFEGGSEAVHFVKPAFLVLHDLEVRNTSANGVNADDGGEVASAGTSHHLVFRGLNIHDIGGTGNQDCLKLSGLDDFTVLDSEFARCGGGMSGSGIDLVGGHHALIARSRFTAMSANAVQAKGGSSDIEVRANVMVDAGGRSVNMGGSTGFEFFRPPLSSSSPNAEARDIRVVANVIQGSDAPVGFVGCVDCLVANNTLVDPSRWVLRILQETVSSGGYVFEPASRGRVINNLVYFNRSRLSTFVNVGPNTTPDSFSFSHNLWYAHDDPARSQPSLPVAEEGGLVGRDPRLDANRKPQAGSPAIGAGIAVQGLRADAAGRCYAFPPSIGAYEGR